MPGGEHKIQVGKCTVYYPTMLPFSWVPGIFKPPVKSGHRAKAARAAAGATRATQHQAGGPQGLLL
jgi:hypothetical protein